MDVYERSKVLRETDQVKEYRGDPIIDAVLQGLNSNEQTPPRIPAGPVVPDGGTSEAFIDGSGI